jgi:hypothetical protein
MRYQQVVSHAKSRAVERYGIPSMNDDLYNSVLRQVRTGKAKFIKKINSNTSLYRVDFAGHWFFPYYDRHSDIITTFIPMNNIQFREYVTSLEKALESSDGMYKKVEPQGSKQKLIYDLYLLAIQLMKSCLVPHDYWKIIDAAKDYLRNQNLEIDNPKEILLDRLQKYD